MGGLHPRPRSGVPVVLLTAWRIEDRLNPIHPKTGPGCPSPLPTPVPSTPHACPQPPRSSGLRPARLACCAEEVSLGALDSGSHTPRRRGDPGSESTPLNYFSLPAAPCLCPGGGLGSLWVLEPPGDCTFERAFGQRQAVARLGWGPPGEAGHPSTPGREGLEDTPGSCGCMPTVGTWLSSPEVRKAGWEGWEPVCQTSCREGV